MNNSTRSIIIASVVAFVLPLCVLAATTASPFGITPASPSLFPAGATNPPFGDIPVGAGDMAPGAGAALSGGGEGGACGQFLKQSRTARTASQQAALRNQWQQCTAKKCAPSGGAGKAGQCPKDPDCESFCTESASSQGALLSCCAKGPQEHPSCKKMIDNTCADTTGRAMGKSDQQGAGQSQQPQQGQGQQGQGGQMPQMPQMPQGGGQGGGSGSGAEQSTQQNCALGAAVNASNSQCEGLVSSQLTGGANTADTSGQITALSAENGSGATIQNPSATTPATQNSVFGWLQSAVGLTPPTSSTGNTDSNSANMVVSQNSFTQPSSVEGNTPVSSGAWSGFWNSVSAAWNTLLGH